LASGVDVVKLSHEELIADGWASRSSTKSVVEGIRRLHAAGAKRVVVSRQHRTTFAGNDDHIVEVRSPALEVLDGRGGGDSMTAALSVASARALPFEDGLRLAAAAAALNVSRHGLGTGRRDSIEEIARHVEIRDVEIGTSHSPRDLGALTKPELYERARREHVSGRSKMTRAELIDALGAIPSP
jgi:1-phosphofructokinase